MCESVRKRKGERKDDGGMIPLLNFVMQESYGDSGE